MKRSNLSFFVPVIFLNCVCAFTEPSLSGFLHNDLELKKLALEVQKSSLSKNKTSIQNGFNVTLSTGSANFKFSGEETNVSFEPSASLTVPQARNLSGSVSSKIKIKNGNNNSTDTTFSLGIDLISSFQKERELTLLKAERSLLESKRKLQNRTLEAEKEYYTTLRNLFSSASEISSAHNTLYDDTVDFEEIKAKGYSKTSAKYRQAEMKVISDKHEIETKIHELEHDCAVFASKCGTDFKDETKPEDFLPKEIPFAEPIDILSFLKENYTKIESAEYEHKIGVLERSAQKDFSLSLSGGYTLKNSNTSFSDDSENSDTINASISSTYKGLSASTGIFIPKDGTEPTYSLSASINPNSFRTAKIDKKTDSYNNEQELIAINSAQNDYDTDVIDKQTELNDIIWSKEQNKKTYDLYSTLTDDMKNLFSEGIVRESEYLNAFSNKELYRFKLIINDIDLIIYNNSTKLLFCRDSEINE